MKIIIIDVMIKSLSPLLIGDGDKDLLIDQESNMAYLPATSIAGSFRSYLRETDEDYAELFGYQSKNESRMSSVYIRDSFSPIKTIERRDGVRIDGKTGSNVSGGKMDRLYFEKGLKFKLSFKIKGDNCEKQKEMIYKCLKALDMGFIRLGGSKSNGLGRFELITVKETIFNLGNIDDFYRYLKRDYNKTEDITEKINTTPTTSNYILFTMLGELTTPLLIKSPETFDPDSVDDSSIKSGNDYIIPGSSFKGVLKSRIQMIADYFNQSENVHAMFGTSKTQKGRNILSRVFVEESIIENKTYAEEVTYNRIKIDKFTGGVRPSALMNDIPVQGEVGFNVVFRKTDKEEFDDFSIGLILLALKDMGTENLMLGGGAGIGRGRFRANTLNMLQGDTKIEIDFNKKIISDEIKLNNYITSIQSFPMKGGVENE